MPPVMASFAPSSADEFVHVDAACGPTSSTKDDNNHTNTTERTNKTDTTGSLSSHSTTKSVEVATPTLLPNRAEEVDEEGAEANFDAPPCPPPVEEALRAELGYEDLPEPSDADGRNTNQDDDNNNNNNHQVCEATSPNTRSDSASAPSSPSSSGGAAAAATKASPSSTDAPPETAKRHRGVRFKSVCIREYEITIGDNPYCSFGVPICLDWNHGEDEVIPIDFYEASHKRKRTARRMLLNSFQRRDMLWRSGYALEDIEKAIKETEKEKFRRSLTLYFLPLYHLQELFYFGAEKCFHSEKNNDSEHIEEVVQKQQMTHLQGMKERRGKDMEIGGMNVVQEYEFEKPRRRLSFKSQASPKPNDNNSSANEPDGDWSVRSGNSISDASNPDRDDPYAASKNSIFRSYSVRVDRGQHDKATEIILCNVQRPHMRAFHASWFSFFTAFFIWFAVTPLLGEIKETLQLNNDQLWISSLCGTAGTIIMRIFMGPACDKFGARICMAFILATSAIPCALTGLVQSAQGLTAVRSFVGIAGGSFVACQYWTSQMFTREVSGTANALVAGWGNLVRI